MTSEGTSNTANTMVNATREPLRPGENEIMTGIYRLKNPIQNYNWGSHDAIAQLLGQPVPSPEPQAELWMGAHPKAPSQVLVDGEWLPLPDQIDLAPAGVLGEEVASSFAGKLPFLFKVLSAARALSIQAHPNLEQAREGFARENQLGIPVAAPNRNYRDENHKPEIICALTPFYALNGFRRLPEMLELLQQVGSSELRPELDHFLARPDETGLEQFFTAIMTMDAARQRRVVAEVVAFAAEHEPEGMVFEWIVKLDEQYPGDIGVLSPLLLNLVRLEPGQAMYSQARQLHAYLYGTGIELMANSDNVLRGGLTSKYIDVPELLEVLTFAEADVVIQTAEPKLGCDYKFVSGADEFQLSLIEVGPEAGYSSPVGRSIEVVICVEGQVTVTDTNGGDRMVIQRGESFLVPATASGYQIEGQGVLFTAAAHVGARQVNLAKSDSSGVVL